MATTLFRGGKRVSERPRQQRGHRRGATAIGGTCLAARPIPHSAGKNHLSTSSDEAAAEAGGKCNVDLSADTALRRPPACFTGKKGAILVNAQFIWWVTQGLDQDLSFDYYYFFFFRLRISTIIAAAAEKRLPFPAALEAADKRRDFWKV